MGLIKLFSYSRGQEKSLSEDQKSELFQLNASVVKPINCIVNRNKTVPCKQVDEEVYMPFKFLSDYFEVGKLSLINIYI